MADIISELLESGSVPPEALAKLLREQEQVGLAGQLSGSARVGPVGEQMRKEAMNVAGKIGDTRGNDALEHMKALMRARQEQDKLADKEAERRNRLAVQRLRNQGMLSVAKARKKGGGVTVDGDKQLGAFETQAAHLEDLANIAKTAQDRTTGWTTGYGSYLKYVKGSDASSLDEYLVPLRSEEALSKLGELREMAYAMGQKGSGLGQVTEKEIQLLTGARRSLELAQNEKQMDAALAHLEQAHRNAAKNIRAELAKLKAGGGVGAIQRTSTEDGEDELTPEQVLAIHGIGQDDIPEEDVETQ